MQSSHCAGITPCTISWFIDQWSRQLLLLPLSSPFLTLNLLVPWPCSCLSSKIHFLLYLLESNILLGFDNSLCNLKHLTGLIILSITFSNLFLFSCVFDVVKGTLMQIWKSLYMFEFIWKNNTLKISHS